MSWINIFGGQTIQPAIVSYLNVTPFITNITLSWASQFQDTNNVVASTMDLNPTVGGLSVTMPDATQTSVGQFVTFNNYGTQSVDINDNSGGLIVAIASGAIFYIYLIDNTTVAGTWRVIPFGLGAGSVITSIGAVSANPTALTITSSTTNPITTNGTFTFTPSLDLDALSAFAGGTGIAVRTAANTWALRTLVAGTGITLTDPDGVAGNPQIAVNGNLILTNLTVGNLNLTGNTISSTAGPINIFPVAGASVFLGSNATPIEIDTNDNITNVNDLTAVSLTGTTITGTTINVGNLSLSGNTISSIAGDIDLTPFAGQSVIVNNLSLSGNTLSSIAGQVIIKPAAGQSVTLGSGVSTVFIDTGANVGGVTSINIGANLAIFANSITSAAGLLVIGPTVSIPTLTVSTALKTTFNPSPIAQAWIYFNGGTSTIIGSFNVASLVRNVAGDYSINWINPMANSNYSVSITCDYNGGAGGVIVGSPYARSPGTLSIHTSTLAGVLIDANVSVVIFD